MMTTIKESEVLFAQGKIEEAEKCFLDLLKNDPKNPEILNNLGVIQHAKSNLQEAEGFFMQALASNEGYLDALLNLADLYQNAKRWKEAATQLEKCIVINTQEPNFYNQLSMVYLEMGNTEKAIEVLNHSLDLNPDQEIVKESLKELEKRDSAPRYLPKPGSFRGAFAEIDITPHLSEHNPVFLQGMGGPPRSATAVSVPLMMQLLLLEDDHFTKILFITADLFGFGPEIVQNVRALVARWGIEPEGLILNASHTHYAPGTISHASKSIGPFYSEYAKQIVQAIGQQLPVLYDKLEECNLFWGKAEAQIGVSRRLKKDGKIIFAPNSEGYYDKDTPFILLHLLKTDKKVLLVNHGCHPTGLGPENVISADYPGYMRNSLKSNGVVDGVMFLQGGAGSTKESVSIDGDVRFCENSTGSKENGEFLATQIINGLEKGLQPVKGSFFCTRRQISLPPKPPPSMSVLAQIRDNAGTDDLVREWTSSLLSRFSNGDFPATLVVEIQLVSVGDKVSFVALPGEPVAELARDLGGLFSNPDSTFVLGYTNGLVGYLPTDTMVEEGGYETEASQFIYLLPSAPNKGTQSAIISATQKCIGALVETDKPNGYGRLHLAMKEQKAFFVLSAGRCGTLTLAHLLNITTNARVWHHPQPDPIKESLLAYWDRIDKREAFWKARYNIIRKTWSEGLIHGETDLLMTPFCNMIAEEIPDSKFIVLVRDPRDFVRSGMRRNYYHGHPWDFGRLRPQEGTEEFESWNKLDQFEKICWLWAKTYENIKQIVSRIGKQRVVTVRFEDMVTGIEKTKEIFDFLGLQGFDDRKFREFISRKFNAQTGGSFPKPEHWSTQLHETLWNSCGAIAEQFGYANTYNQQISREPYSKAKHERKTTENEALPQYDGKVSFCGHNKAIDEARTKIGFLCSPGLESRLIDIISLLKSNYEVKSCYTGNLNEIELVANWADIIWLEWANELAIYVTNKIPSISKKKVICRVHSYEVLSGYLPKIKWSNIDRVIFVSNHLQRIANQIYPSLRHETISEVIFNGIDLNKFSFKTREPGFNIAVVARINHKKNPAMWIEIMSRLIKLDPRYTLKIAGGWQELRYKYYLEHIIHKMGISKNIQFFGWVKDVSNWFEKEKINYLLSTSVFESFGSGIGEAMSMGYKPLIHNFPYAEEIWPSDCIFNSIDELIENVENRKDYNSGEYRRFVEENYSLTSHLNQINSLIKNLENKMPLPSSVIELPNRTMQISLSNQAGADDSRLHQPHHNLIVTGIPRSGTSLLSTIINKFKNAVCLNEILYNVDSLPESFVEIRRRLIAGEAIPNRYDSSGNLATDTQGSTVNVENKVIKGIDEHVVIGSKINIPYLNQIQAILDYGYKVIAIVRDPVYTIGSWNSKKAGTIPEAHVTDDDMHPRWRGFKFTSDDKIDRQAQIWNFYTHLIWNLRDKLKIYTYELLTSDLEWVINDICEILGLEPHREIVKLKNQNIDSKYPKIERIKEAVRKYCPIKNVFGYSYLDYEEPAELMEKHEAGAKEQTAWSRDINYSRRAILAERGVDSSHLIIAFGGIANMLYLPPFEFFRATNSLRYSKILVRDFNQAWYHLGVDQELTSFDALLNRLRQLIEDLKPVTIGTIGTSAGGYAALAFGHYLKADCVHVLAPQTFIDQENRNRIGDKRWPREIARLYEKEPISGLFYDLKKLLQKYNGKTVYNIHVSRSHQLDMAHAEHIKDLPRVYINKYPCIAHNVAQYLKENHLLARLLEKPVCLKETGYASQSDDSNAKTGEYKVPALANACCLQSHRRQEDTYEEFKNVEKYCMFIGYPRSGHSIIGSLLDAHPNVIIGHEMDAFSFVMSGSTRGELYKSIIENSRAFTKAGRKWTGYSYAVPNQWHGRCTELKVIGDKKGGRSVWHLRSNPDLLSKLRDVVGVDAKLIHVIRNPFDNISTIFKKEQDKGLRHAIEFYFEMADTVAEVKKTVNGQDLHEIKLESFIADSHGQLTKLCAFLGVDASEDYLRDCSSIVFSSPHKTRETVDWSPDLIELVQGTIVKYSFMTGYSYES